ncbi:putative quinol monooxygenase [Shewanella japonica]|uniref:putative quinol monooxygenase n=1 Tax=Shewanella japonica TaxID=93973 RepID=UPI002493E6AD|nr:antibiotic biosynthesis monooxygenase [Shewanella japonica]
MSRVRLTGYILVVDEDLSAVKQALPLHRKLTLAEPGCVSFEVLPDNKNPNKYNVDEVFTDQMAFEVHQARVKQSAWGRLTVNVTRHYQMSDTE